VAFNRVANLQNSSTDVTGNRLSPAIWGDFPIGQIREDPNIGFFKYDDFIDFTPVAAGAQALYGNYYGFGSTGGTVAVADEVGGAITLSSDGDDEGASLAMPMKPAQISRSHKLLCAEFRIKVDTIADTKNGFFLGLADALTLSATVPIAAAGTLADENFVGFHRLEGDGDKLDVVYKADGVTQVTVLADAVTLVADTYVNVGMRFEPRGPAGLWYMRFFANNVELSSARLNIIATAGTDFPNDVRMGLVAAILNATGSTPGNLKMDSWALGQIY
jgi:hypothetical protein